VTPKSPLDFGHARSLSPRERTPQQRRVLTNTGREVSTMEKDLNTMKSALPNISFAFEVAHGQRAASIASTKDAQFRGVPAAAGR